MFDNLSFFRKNTIVKIVSILLIQTFLFYTVGFTAPVQKITSYEQKDTLAPYVVSQLVLNESTIKRLDRALARAKEIGDSGEHTKLTYAQRAERIKRAWVRKYLGEYLAKTHEDVKGLGFTLGEKSLHRIFLECLTFEVKALEAQLQNNRDEIIGDIDKLVNEEIGSLCQASGFTGADTTPGQGPARIIQSEEMLSLEQARAYDSVLARIFKERPDAVRRVKVPELPNSEYVVIRDDVLDQFIKEYNEDPDHEVKIPVDLEVVPGTNKTRFRYNPDDPESFDRDVEKHFYIRETRFHVLRQMGDDAVLDLARHEHAHIMSAMGLIPALRGDRTEEERYIRYELGYDISDIVDEFAKLREKQLRAYYLRRIADIVDFVHPEKAPSDAAKQLKDVIVESVDYFFNTGDAIPVAIILQHFVKNKEERKIYDLFKSALKMAQAERAVITTGVFQRALDARFFNDYQRNEIARVLRDLFTPEEVPTEEKIAVIMAGGGGTRLFPLSTSDDPKQLLKLFGEKSTLRISIQRTIDAGFPLENIYVQTIPAYAEKIREMFKEMGLNPANVIAEPEAADTAAAFGYAWARLVRDGKGNKPVFIGTADHIIEMEDGEFVKTVNKALAIAWRNPVIGTMGITPDGPSEEFGHIHKGEETPVYDVFPVASFEEKPKGKRAQELFERGDLFNSGMFIATGDTVMKSFSEVAEPYFEGFQEIIAADEKDFDEVVKRVFARFAAWKGKGVSPKGRKVSYDYTIAEPLSKGESKSTGIFTIPGRFGWRDIGGYPAIYYEYMEGSHANQGGTWRREGTNVVIENPGDNVTVSNCSGCLIFIKDKDPEDTTPVNIAIEGLKDQVVVYNPRTRTTLVAPLKLKNLGDLLKAVQGKVLKLNEYTTQFIKGGKIALAEKKAEVVNIDPKAKIEERLKAKGLIKSMETEDVKAECNDGLLILLGVKDKEIVVKRIPGKQRDELEINIRPSDKDWEVSAKPKPVHLSKRERQEDIYGILMRGEKENVTAEEYAAMYDVDVAAAKEELDELASLECEKDIDLATGQPRGQFAGIMKTYPPILNSNGKVKEADKTKGYVYTRLAIDEKIFGSYDLRNVADVYFPDKVCFYLGRITASRLIEEFGKNVGRVFVTREVRAAGKRMQDAFIQGLLVSGISACCSDEEGAEGVLSTPDMYFATALIPGVRLGVTMTASHNPAPHCGIKFNKLFGEAGDYSGGYLESVTKAYVQKMKAIALDLRNKKLFVLTDEGDDSKIREANISKRYPPGLVAEFHKKHIQCDVLMGPEIANMVMSRFRKQKSVSLYTFLEEMHPILMKGDWEAFRQYIARVLNLELPEEKPNTFVPNIFRGLKVVLDAANSAAFRSISVYEELGAKVAAINNEPESAGDYLHDPDPTKIKNLRQTMEILSIVTALEDILSKMSNSYEKKDTVGFSHDSDADRLGIVRSEVSKIGNYSPVIEAISKAFELWNLSHAKFSDEITIKPLAKKSDDLKKDEQHYVVKYKDDILFTLKVKTDIRSLDSTTRIYLDDAEIASCENFVIAGDRLACILAKEELETYAKGGLVVSEVKGTTSMLKEYVEAAGGVYRERQTGFAFIKEYMRQNGALMGAEMSGHFFFSDVRNFRFDDSFFAAANLLSRMAMARRFGTKGIRNKKGDTLRTLKDLDDDIPRSPSTPELRINTEDSTPDQRESWYVKPLVAYFKDVLGYEVDTIDGAKVTFRDSDGKWIGSALVRKSNNEPKLISRVWGVTEHRRDEIKRRFFKTIQMVVEKEGHKVDFTADDYVKTEIAPFLDSPEITPYLSEGVVGAASVDKPWMDSDRTPGIGMAQSKTAGLDEQKGPSEPEIWERAQLFSQSLIRLLEEKKGETIVLAIDSDLGKRQDSQIQSIKNAIREIEEMKDDKGERLFPNLRVITRSGRTAKGIDSQLVQEIQAEIDKGAKKENVLIVTRKANIDRDEFDELKGIAWIAGIDDITGNRFDYLPVFEAATLLVMSALNIHGDRISKLYNSIAEKPITSVSLREMQNRKVIYILPKMDPVDPDELREIYDTVKRIYLAA